MNLTKITRFGVFIISSALAFGQTARTHAVSTNGKLTEHGRTADRQSWNAPSFDVWNSDFDAGAFLNSNFVKPSDAPEVNRDPESVNSVQTRAILRSIPKPSAEQSAFLKYVHFSEDQAKAVTTTIEGRTGILGGLFTISAVTGELSSESGSASQYLISVAQRNSSGDLVTFLLYVGEKYVNYKPQPVVRMIDTKALPDLMHMRLVMAYGREATEEYSRLVFSTKSEENKIIRKRVGIIAIRNGAASVVDDLGVVTVDGCGGDPKGYMVLSRVGYQRSSDQKDLRHYYEHQVAACRSGSEYKFESSLDGESAYEWAASGNRDILQ